MRILITGGAGFVGSNLAPQTRRAPYRSRHPCVGLGTRGAIGKIV